MGPAAVNVYADDDRISGYPAVNDRLLEFACGAAVFNIRLAMRANGLDPVVRLLPAASRRSLLASVRVAGRTGRPVAEDRFWRSQDDGPGHPPAAQAGLRALSEEAMVEGATLRILKQDGLHERRDRPAPRRDGPILAILSTVTDSGADRLRAGQAFRRIELAAAEAGLTAHALPDLRQHAATAGRLRPSVREAWTAQMCVRLTLSV